MAVLVFVLICQAVFSAHIFVLPFIALGTYLLVSVVRDCQEMMELHRNLPIMRGAGARK